MRNLKKESRGMEGGLGLKECRWNEIRKRLRPRENSGQNPTIVYTPPKVDFNLYYPFLMTSASKLTR